MEKSAPNKISKLYDLDYVSKTRYKNSMVAALNVTMELEGL